MAAVAVTVVVVASAAAVAVALAAVAVVAVVAVVASEEVRIFWLYNCINPFFIVIFTGWNSGPPERVCVIAEVSHIVEGQIVGMVKGSAVPLLARQIWTENKQLIGKVDDVFGPKNQPGIAVNADANSGVKAESFKAGDKVS